MSAAEAQEVKSGQQKDVVPAKTVYPVFATQVCATLAKPFSHCEKKLRKC